MKLLLQFLICCPLLYPMLNAQTLVKGGFATSSNGDPSALCGGNRGNKTVTVNAGQCIKLNLQQ